MTADQQGDSWPEGGFEVTSGESVERAWREHGESVDGFDWLCPSSLVVVRMMDAAKQQASQTLKPAGFLAWARVE